MTKEEKIYKYAEENNLIAGIGTAESFEMLKGLPIMPFTEKDIEKRVNPNLTVEGAKSIIALGLCYNKKFCGETDNKLRGKISVGAVGEDYHNILKRHLESLMEYTQIDGKAFSDTGPLSDRAAAIRCGLGFAGKNGNVINERFGSFFFIGYIITAEKLTPLEYVEKISCGDCERCIKACPSGALSEKGFDYKKCISYITQAKNIDFSQMEIMGKNIYGCDMCQKSCRYNNKNIEKIYDIDAVYPLIEEIILMDNASFKKRFKETAAGWRGKKIIQRNALIAAVNSRHIDREKIINMCKDDERDEIKRVMKWVGTLEG